jgi:hypothetical protein
MIAFIITKTTNLNTDTKSYKFQTVTIYIPLKKSSEPLTYKAYFTHYHSTFSIKA